MALKYNVNDRYMGGSCDPRLDAKIVNTELNAKLGPRFPPKEREPGVMRRRAVIGVPQKLENSR